MRVTEQDGKFRYQFGKPKRAELVFENDRQEAIDRLPRWGGIGRDLWTNLVLQNGDYQYALFSSMDRLSPRHETVYGVTVHRLVNGKKQYVIQVKCSKKAQNCSQFSGRIDVLIAKYVGLSHTKRPSEKSFSDGLCFISH